MGGLLILGFFCRMFAFMEGCVLDSRPHDKATCHDETFKKQT